MIPTLADYTEEERGKVEHFVGHVHSHNCDECVEGMRTFLKVHERVSSSARPEPARHA